MEVKIGGYFRQILYTFNKLVELSFDKGKPHNPSLIAGIRAILSTIEYNEKPIEEVQMSTRERNIRKHSPSLTQSFSNIFKRRNSAVSEASNLSLSLELDANIKQSKSQYQAFRIRKLSFEASDLSKHPIKNLQMTINILSDKGDEKDGDGNGDNPPKQTTQNISSSSRSFLKIPNKEKGKGMD